MTDAKRARLSVEEVLSHLELCASAECSFCRDGCPSYRAFLLESKAPRGKNRVLMKRLPEGDDGIRSLSTVAYECSVCGRCSEVCISGGDTFSIIPEIRARLAEEGSVPNVLEKGARDAMKTGTPYSSKDRSWADGLPGKGKVGYFPGCNFMANEPDVPKRTVHLLGRLGIEPVPISDHCCGGPAFNAGLTDLFHENAEAFIADLKEKGVRKVILSCPGCLNILRNEFPKSGVEFVHLVQVLAEADVSGRIGMRVAYHDPCNLGRKSYVVDPPRALLKAIGCEVLEFADSGPDSACCGGGGGFATLHPDGSAVSSTDRVTEALEMGADAIVTACRTCRDRLAEAAGDRIPVYLVLDLADGTIDGFESALEGGAVHD